MYLYVFSTLCNCLNYPRGNYPLLICNLASPLSQDGLGTALVMPTNLNHNLSKNGIRRKIKSRLLPALEDSAVETEL